MLSDLINASGWSHEQWITVSIGVFIGVAVLVLVYRIITIFKLTRRKSYKPNLRPLRRRRFRNNNSDNEN